MLRQRLAELRAERQGRDVVIPRRGLRRGMNLAELEANAHRPEVQELIRREIFKGTIRIVPERDGRVRLVPTSEHTNEWSLDSDRD